MCEKFRQLETQIQEHRRFLNIGLDQRIVGQIKAHIEELQRRKEAMH